MFFLSDFFSILFFIIRIFHFSNPKLFECKYISFLYDGRVDFVEPVLLVGGVCGTIEIVFEIIFHSQEFVGQIYINCIIEEKTG